MTIRRFLLPGLGRLRQTLCRLPVVAVAGLLLATGCGGHATGREATATDSAANEEATPWSPIVSFAKRTDSLLTAEAGSLKEELDYYLDRHNVQDEGYEMVAAFAQGNRHQVETDSIPIWNVGRWRDHPQRQGTAISRDTEGRIVVGNWEQDTLVSGLRLDSTGYYQGGFRNGKAHGHGSYTAVNKTYFEGHWEQDKREGFGLQLLQNDFVTVLKVGQWSDELYRGERMNYTSERIYGIDISRYQHGKGRKKYAIQWNKLRISHLGSKSQKQASGLVDYPVNFCYIKSTEGVSIRNPYYAADYNAARKQGVHTGAYHFFSTRTSGSAQAAFFLRNTSFRRGDMPPVLDVEPSAKDISKMGGAKAMFRNIRAWLEAVEKHCGVKPILYVSQRFVNNYLPEAPDVKSAYKVWIARYGEYRPDVRLAIWQLSPDGRVRGITGEVDINVFNGYQQQFDDFIENETIK